MTNPYAAFLEDGKDPLEVVGATAALLEAAVHSHDADTLNRNPAPGKWSVREILCHLADCEIVFAFRLRQALAEDRHVIQPFDQDRWAMTYAAYPAAAAVAVFSSVRRWNLAFIGALQPEGFAKRLNHPERGDMTLRTVVETMAGHDRNHLKQIAAILM